MSEVIIRKASYDYSVLRPAVFDLLKHLDNGLIKKNARVLLKPNLLAPSSPDKAMLTHPMVMRAAAEYVLEKSALLQISDSPAMGSFAKVLEESGIRTALKGLDVEYKEFRQSSIVDVGPPFNKIEIAGDALEADVIINIPKLKTHTQMLLTLGVKNLFGCVVGLKKPEWHFRTGVDREKFALLLVRIAQAVRPAITILDGILAMEGQGPGRSGSPRHLGVLMGSNDVFALDITVCSMLGINPDRLLTNRASKGLRSVDEPIEIDGTAPLIDDFRLPEITPLVFGPPVLHGFMRRHLVQRPVSDDSLCRLCGECWRYCPAEAISRDGNRIAFDYDKCIRCYCCMEVCPHGALSTRETAAGRIVRKLIRRHDN